MGSHGYLATIMERKGTSFLSAAMNMAGVLRDRNSVKDVRDLFFPKGFGGGVMGRVNVDDAAGFFLTHCPEAVQDIVSTGRPTPGQKIMMNHARQHGSAFLFDEPGGVSSSMIFAFKAQTMADFRAAVCARAVGLPSDNMTMKSILSQGDADVLSERLLPMNGKETREEARELFRDFVVDSMQVSAAWEDPFLSAALRLTPQDLESEHSRRMEASQMRMTSPEP